MSNGKILACLAVALLCGALGGFVMHELTPAQAPITQVVTSGTSAQGSTGQTARQYNVYGVNLAAPGTNATTSAVYNGTGNTLFITGIKVGCTGVGTSLTQLSGAGLASLQVTAATSTVGTTLLGANGNSIGGGALVIGTSSNAFVFASSTAAAPGINSTKGYQIWPAGTYITFNTNATNTAICTFGVDVTSS